MLLVYIRILQSNKEQSVVPANVTTIIFCKHRGGETELIKRSIYVAYAQWRIHDDIVVEVVT